MRTAILRLAAIVSTTGLLASFSSTAATASGTTPTENTASQSILQSLDQEGVQYSLSPIGNVLVYDESNRSSMTTPAAVIVSPDSKHIVDGETVYEIGNPNEVSPDTLAILPELSDFMTLRAIETITHKQLTSSQPKDIEPANEENYQFRANCQTAYSVGPFQTSWSAPQNGCSGLIGTTWGTNVNYQFNVSINWNYGACFQGKGHSWYIDHNSGQYYVSNNWVNLGCIAPSPGYTSRSLNWGNVAGVPAMKQKAATVGHASGGLWRF